MKKNFIAIYTVLIVLIMIGDIFYIIYDKLWIKSITSAGFVLLGIVCLVQIILHKEKKLKFPIIMLVGLFFAMLGDIILNIQFITGAALFAIGHIFYFISYCFLLKLIWKDIIPGAVIFVCAILFITLAPIFDFGVAMEVVCCIYAFIISFMVGKSISNTACETNVRNIMIVSGSCLFFFSDLMLLLNVFADLGRVVSVLCLITYYPAQCILALSISIIVYLHEDESESTDLRSIEDKKANDDKRSTESIY